MWVWATRPQLTFTLAALFYSSSSSWGCAPSPSPQLPFPSLPSLQPWQRHGGPWACKQPCTKSIFPVFATQDCRHSNSVISGFTTLTSHLPHIRRMCLSLVFSCAQTQRDGLKVQGRGCFRRALGRAVCTHWAVQIWQTLLISQLLQEITHLVPLFNKAQAFSKTGQTALKWRGEMTIHILN